MFVRHSLLLVVSLLVVVGCLLFIRCCWLCAVGWLLFGVLWLLVVCCRMYCVFVVCCFLSA